MQYILTIGAQLILILRHRIRKGRFHSSKCDIAFCVGLSMTGAESNEIGQVRFGGRGLFDESGHFVNNNNNNNGYF